MNNLHESASDSVFRIINSLSHQAPPVISAFSLIEAPKPPNIALFKQKIQLSPDSAVVQPFTSVEDLSILSEQRESKVQDTYNCLNSKLSSKNMDFDDPIGGLQICSDSTDTSTTTACINKNRPKNDENMYEGSASLPYKVKHHLRGFCCIACAKSTESAEKSSPTFIACFGIVEEGTQTDLTSSDVSRLEDLRTLYLAERSQLLGKDVLNIRKDLNLSKAFFSSKHKTKAASDMANLHSAQSTKFKINIIQNERKPSNENDQSFSKKRPIKRKKGETSKRKDSTHPGEASPCSSSASASIDSNSCDSTILANGSDKMNSTTTPSNNGLKSKFKIGKRMRTSDGNRAVKKEAVEKSNASEHSLDSRHKQERKNNFKRPKRALTPYILFYKDNASILRKEYPNKVTRIEFSQALAKRWQNLESEKRAYYERLADNDRSRYMKEKQQYLGVAALKQTGPNSATNSTEHQELSQQISEAVTDQRESMSKLDNDIPMSEFSMAGSDHLSLSEQDYPLDISNFPTERINTILDADDDMKLSAEYQFADEKKESVESINNILDEDDVSLEQAQVINCQDI